MRSMVAVAVACGLFFGLAYFAIRSNISRPDIRIVARTEYASIDGRPRWSLEWAVNGTMQAPAFFVTEEERGRFEEYLGTVGRVSE